MNKNKNSIMNNKTKSILPSKLPEERNGPLYILTGYIGDGSFLSTLDNILRDLKNNAEKGVGKIRYVCDPVMGDEGKLYVPASVVEKIQLVINHAWILAPNQFELEILTGVKIISLDDAKKACNLLHQRGVSIIVVTSLHLDTVLWNETERTKHESRVIMFCSYKSKQSQKQRAHTKMGDTRTVENKNSTDTTFIVSVPKIDRSFVGTGDLMSSLLLVHCASLNEDDTESVFRAALVEACTNVMTTMNVVCRDTALSGSYELRVIPNKDALEIPPREEVDVRVSYI
eukprot:g978.t1